jgi:hypothetical protein
LPVFLSVLPTEPESLLATAPTRLLTVEPRFCPVLETVLPSALAVP